MKYPKIILCGLVAVNMVAVVSCKKKTDESAHARLTGKWKLKQFWFDINNNATIDGGEVMDAPYALAYTFAGDGTGNYADSAGSFIIPFTWTLQNKDADLALKGNAIGGGGADTFHISILTSTDLRIYQTDDSTHIRTYRIMKKQ